MKLIFLVLLMFAAPILNITGMVELKTLSAIGIGFMIGRIFEALPDGIKRNARHTRY